jgi:hypothetical protein
MLTFPELERRLNGLLTNLDGELWPEILKQVNPPEPPQSPDTIHDMAFRDAKALAGYAPDLRAIIRSKPPKSLTPEELQSINVIRGLYNLAARLLVLLLTIPDLLTNNNLIDLYNGYRQILVELDSYLLLALGTE